MVVVYVVVIVMMQEVFISKFVKKPGLEGEKHRFYPKLHEHMGINVTRDTKDQNRGLVRDVRALLRNCIFGITPDRDGM